MKRKLEFICARLFGLRIIGVDGDTKAVAYVWRRHLYIMEMKRP